MTTYVLVHGAWHGGWCWKRVISILESKGYAAFAPTLTGVGERSHLLSADIDLDTHVSDVLNLIKWEEIDDIVLCGHSYGGMVISGVADAIPERVRSLVYLDAFVPENGKCMFDYLPPENAERMKEAANANPDRAVPPITAERFNVNLADREWVDRQCVPHPLATFTQPIRLTENRGKVPKRTYIRALGLDPSPYARIEEKFADDPSWISLQVPCGHDVMLDMPEELADMLVNAA